MTPRQKIDWKYSTQQQAWQSGRPSAGTGGSPDLRLDGRRHQAWLGFGGCFNELGWLALAGLSARDRARLLDVLFDPGRGIGFTYCRLPIGASDYAAEWYSHNETPGDYGMKHFSIERDRKILIPYIKQALRRQPGLTLFASPWSPPTWMKHPRAYNYGTMIWEPKILRAYALYFVKFVQAYKKEGIDIHQVHVQNEPVADQKFPSCLWTGEQMRDFIRDYLGPAFRRHGVSAGIWLGTINTDDYDGFPNLVLSDARARKFVAGVGFQWAGKGAIQRAYASWPEVPLAQTENECGDGQNTWAYAMYVHNLVQHYLSNGASAYVYWNMVLAQGGLSTWGWKQNSMITIDPRRGGVQFTPDFHVMRHFAQFIRPGAVRLGVAGRWAANTTAFANADGSTVAVIGNPFAFGKKIRAELDGCSFAAELPPQSINTFVCRG